MEKKIYNHLKTKFQTHYSAENRTYESVMIHLKNKNNNTEINMAIFFKIKVEDGTQILKKYAVYAENSKPREFYFKKQVKDMLEIKQIKLCNWKNLHSA